LLTSVFLQVLAAMTLVEAIFLAERFPIVFRDVLKNNASLLDTSLILACSSSQIFDLALAIAILTAVYWTVLRMRENRELLAIFAAGAGPYRIMLLVFGIAVCAQICSFFVSGVIDPMSRYAQRVILFNAEFHALSSGVNTGQFYFFPNRVVYAPARSDMGRRRAGGGQSRSLFIYEQVAPDTFRLVTADRARLEGPDAAGRILLTLGGLTSRLFPDVEPRARNVLSSSQVNAKTCVSCPTRQQDASPMTLAAREIVRQTTVDELMAFRPRGSEAAELTIFEQLGVKPDTKPRRREEDMRLLGERFVRSLLCLLAPLIALASVCLTVRATDYIVLPLACMALMLLNVTSEWLIRTIAPLEPLSALLIPSTVVAVSIVLLLALIVRRQGELVRPSSAGA
jgi:lipopolysaccharide export LptBFGC system permease protein LptF